jgi:hypothetical protein
MIPARVDTATIVKAVTAAVAANTAFWVAQSAVAPKPRTLAPAWQARTELLAMAAPRQAAAEPGAWRGVAWCGGRSPGALCVCPVWPGFFVSAVAGGKRASEGVHTHHPPALTSRPPLSLSPHPLISLFSPHPLISLAQSIPVLMDPFRRPVV